MDRTIFCRSFNSIEDMSIVPKTALVTGGAQGIGKIIAATLIRAGMEVVILDRDGEAGAETERELGPRCHFLLCNITFEGLIKGAVARTVDRFGRLDLLVNNAAISINKPVEELSLMEWEQVLSVNLTAPFLFAKYGAPHLRAAKGCIVNLASTRAYMSEANTEAYSASKGGIVALTHALAMSLGPDVRVNSVSPGWIDVTPHQKKSVREPYQMRPEDHAQHPVGRVGRPEDIAELVAYLASPAAGFITGQDFVVDGGMTRKMIYV